MEKEHGNNININIISPDRSSNNLFEEIIKVATSIIGSVLSERLNSSTIFRKDKSDG